MPFLYFYFLLFRYKVRLQLDKLLAIHLDLGKMKFLLLLISYIYLTSYDVDAHRSGAPEGTCKSMNPKHGVNAETTPAPYEVSVKPLNGQFEVSIKSKNFNKFRGFFLQAREKDNPDEIVDGEFTLPSNTKHVNCESSKSALTHNSNIDKDEITTVWTPRGGYKGYIIFRATVVKTAKEFWTMVDSDPVEVSDSHIPSTDTTKKPMPDKSLLTYDECGGTKGCFGMPDKCIEKKNCDILFSYTYESGKDLVQFEISTKVDSISGHWIAVGLSEDQFMGSDSVGDCVVANGKPSFHYSWNEDKSNAIRNKISGIEVVSATLKDGILSCKWTREISLVENGISFDLMNNKYYLLLANGPLESSSPIIKRQHDSTLYSSSNVNLTSISNITGSSSFAPLFKAHGSLMIIAWAGLVSIGILLARHYKDGWDEKTLCNVKIWFALHRAFMVTAVLMIVTAFILVFVYLKQWTNKATTHAILGCVATGFAVLQPIGALFRPGPTDSKRPIFNWLHWMGGNAGFISAIVTIFFSTDLLPEKVQNTFTWVFAIFVIYHVLFQILIQIYVFQLEKRKKTEINMIELSAEKVEKSKKLLDFTFKEKLLAIYVIPVIILIITLVCLICIQ